LTDNFYNFKYIIRPIYNSKLYKYAEAINYEAPNSLSDARHNCFMKP